MEVQRSQELAHRVWTRTWMIQTVMELQLVGIVMWMKSCKLKRMKLYKEVRNYTVTMSVKIKNLTEFLVFHSGGSTSNVSKLAVEKGGQRKENVSLKVQPNGRILSYRCRSSQKNIKKIQQ